MGDSHGLRRSLDYGKRGVYPRRGLFPANTATDRCSILSLTEIVNFRVNLQPCLLLRGGEMLHDFHYVAHHLLADAADERTAFGRDADHDLAPILPRARAHDVTKILQTRDQATGRSSGVPHLLRDGRHREHFLLIQISEKKKLRERDIARREFLAQMQDQTTLHFHDDVGQLLRIRSELIRRLAGGCCGKCSIQRALKLKWSS